MAKKKFSSVWIVEQYKTVLPDGLTISRNNLKFTIKWKIKDKNYGGGQQLQWRLNNAGDWHSISVGKTDTSKVLELSDKIVADNHLTAMMITHNMSDAIAHGNRLIMMNAGRTILDIQGEEKKHLTKEALLRKFAEVAGVQEETDSVLLS